MAGAGEREGPHVALAVREVGVGVHVLEEVTLVVAQDGVPRDPPFGDDRLIGVVRIRKGNR
jgi:hypothetical protein